MWRKVCVRHRRVVRYREAGWGGERTVSHMNLEAEILRVKRLNGEEGREMGKKRIYREIRPILMRAWSSANLPQS